MLTSLEGAGRQAKTQNANWAAAQATAAAMPKPRKGKTKPAFRVQKVKNSSKVALDIPNPKPAWLVVATTSPEAAEAVNLIYQGGNELSPATKARWKKLDPKQKKFQVSLIEKVKEKFEKEVMNFIDREILQSSTRIEKGIEALVKKYQKNFLRCWEIKRNHVFLTNPI